MKAGSWGSVLLVYLYSILCAASISKLVPIERDIEHTLGTTPAGVGFAISIISVFSIFAATIGGGIIDRIGTRWAIISGSLSVIAANAISYFAPSMFMLNVARVIEGFEFVTIMVAAPALIMATTQGRRQVHAMSLWSTYIPAGYGLGLLIAVPFTGTPHWRGTFVVQGALFTAALLLVGLLPEVPRQAREEKAAERKSRVADLLTVYREIGPVRLSLSNAALVSVGLGTSTVVPRYFSQTHHLTIAASSTISASTMLAMIVGGVGTGLILSRGLRTVSLYAGITLAGIAAGIVVYAPWLTLPIAVAGLVAWQATTGAASAALMALLPKVVQDPTRGAAASGLVGQVMAFTNFVTPPFYFRVLGEGNWRYFVVLVVACWFLSLVILPAWSGRVAERERAASLS